MSAQRLFISHASEDEAVVNRIVSYLEAHGMPCWVSSRDIPPRAIYADAITAAVQTCSACIVVLSAATNDSKAVKRELELASHYDKPFIPIRIDRSEPAAGMDYYLRNTQWLDYGAERERALDRIVAATTGAPPPHPKRRLVPKAVISLAALGALGVAILTAPILWTAAGLRPISQGSIQSLGEANTVTHNTARHFPNQTASAGFCDLMQNVAQQAPAGFATWRSGEPLPQRGGATFWTSTELLPGAHDCAIATYPDTTAPSFVCFWNTVSDEAASAAALDLGRTLRTCPQVIRGLRGEPAIGRAQFEIRTLPSQPDVVTLTVADTSSLAADDARIRAGAPRFPNNTAAADFCGTVSRLAQAAQSDFNEWKTGPATARTTGQLWASTYRLPGAESCQVGHSNGNPRPFFGCHWNLSSALAAREEAEALVRFIRTCPGIETSEAGHPRLNGATLYVQPMTGEPAAVQVIVSPGYE